MNSERSEMIMATIVEAAQNGRLGGLTIEYWVGGGQPPPYYRSEQFRVSEKDSVDQMVFSILRFDDRYEPPQLSETFSLPARRENIQTIAQLLIAASPFSHQFPEENNPGNPSAISTELIVSSGEDRVEKRFFGSVPEALVPLSNEVTRLIEKTEAEGEHCWYHNGERVPNPEGERHP